MILFQSGQCRLHNGLRVTYSSRGEEDIPRIGRLAASLRPALRARSGPLRLHSARAPPGQALGSCQLSLARLPPSRLRLRQLAATPSPATASGPPSRATRVLRARPRRSISAGRSRRRLVGEPWSICPNLGRAEYISAMPTRSCASRRGKVLVIHTALPSFRSRNWSSSCK